VGYRHSSDEICAAALDVATTDGLGAVTFGRVARRLGISDRMVVYYFPTKDDLVLAVLTALGARLQGTLEAAIGAPAPDHVALVRAALPHLGGTEIDRIFALFFEANGLAATGVAPYDRVVPQLVEAWISWTANHLSGPARHRRAEAEAAIALIDGLLLLRALAGTGAADRAARRLGVR
jgi:AcrR family transcriptional regulator